ncbi:trypco2 family protein [Streptomyces sp. R41]|uniref:Trypco2 family protein n=1 Tax=Streptomyces sp. R41 TaxID=3238632 RepID=A0AB39R9Y7_9ACTN
MADEPGLAVVLEGLRDELEEAWRTGRDREVRFQVTGVTLTLETVTRQEKDGSGRIRWYVVEAGGGVKAGGERTQTLVLSLEPLMDGKSLTVHGQQPVPPR